MSRPDCDNPRVGQFLRELLSGSSPPFGEGLDVRFAQLHVRICQACREQFPGAEWKLDHILFRAILDGSETVWPEDLRAIDEHTNDCTECRLEHPDVLRGVVRIRQQAPMWAAKNLEAIKHEFLSKKHALLAGVDSSDWAAYEEIVGLLRSANSDINYQLEYIHDTGGLANFRVIWDEGNYEEARVRAQTASFMNSLPKDTQQFIFAAILAYELDPGLDPVPNPNTYYDVLWVAAAEYLRRYLEDQAEGIRQAEAKSTSSEVGGTAVGELNVLLDERFREIKDDLDSVKAVQDAIFSEQESTKAILSKLQSSRERSADLEPFIRESLGRIHDRIELHTRELLREAEYLYRDRTKSGTCRYAILGFALAYEKEFLAKIIHRFGIHIIKQGITRYPAQSKEAYSIVVDGKLNEDLSLGAALDFLYNDEKVKDFVEQQGLDPHEIRKSSADVRPTRNNAAHPRNMRNEQEATEKIRDLLLGPKTILRFLIPGEDLSTGCTDNVA